MEVPFDNLRAIVAVDPGGVIGADGRIPWHFAEDLRHFRRLTVGHTVIMGRKTLQAIGRPLPERNNWVLSKTFPETSGLRVLRSLKNFLAALHAAADREKFWVMGGGEIYRQLLPWCVEVICTEIFTSHAGDTFWQMPNYFQRGDLLLRTDDFAIHTWHRSRPANGQKFSTHPCDSDLGCAV